MKQSIRLFVYKEQNAKGSEEEKEEGRSRFSRSIEFPKERQSRMENRAWMNPSFIAARFFLVEAVVRPTRNRNWVVRAAGNREKDHEEDQKAAGSGHECEHRPRLPAPLETSTKVWCPVARVLGRTNAAGRTRRIQDGRMNELVESDASYAFWDQRRLLELNVWLPTLSTTIGVRMAINRDQIAISVPRFLENARGARVVAS
ncbi:hypothetical protein KM043_014038 [Ampulex compressa]|nr:hypothetical protein KM043_014038 [Ampulex compressa]